MGILGRIRELNGAGSDDSRADSETVRLSQESLHYSFQLKVRRPRAQAPLYP